MMEILMMIMIVMIEVMYTDNDAIIASYYTDISIPS